MYMKRKVEITLRECQGFSLVLFTDQRVIQLEAGYFAADISTVALVKIKQAGYIFIAALRDVLIYKAEAQIGTTEAVQVHSQEGGFGGYVAIAETLVEFYTIENAKVMAKKDMLGMQVSMAITCTLLFYAAFEKVSVGLYEIARVILDGIELLFRDAFPEVFLSL